MFNRVSLGRLSSSTLLISACALISASEIFASRPLEVGGKCPGRITTSVVLIADIIATPADSVCIDFGADNIKVEMNGFSIDMRPSPFSIGTAFQVIGRRNVRIDGPGRVLTGYKEGGGIAVRVHSTSNFRMRDLTLTNLLSGVCVPQPASTGGQALFLEGVSGALVHDNRIECYSFAIWLVQSTGTPTADVISHNVLLQNTGFGIGVYTSSQWIISHNTLIATGTIDLANGSAVQMNDGSTGNQVLGNHIEASPGFGIATLFAAGNAFIKNRVLLSGVSDLHDYGTGNFWNDNNVCHRESGGVPPTVCNPTEGQ